VGIPLNLEVVYILNPYLHGGTAHRHLIAQRFKKYPLKLWTKTEFFNTTVKSVSYTLNPPWSVDSGICFIFSGSTNEFRL